MTAAVFLCSRHTFAGWLLSVAFIAFAIGLLTGAFDRPPRVPDKNKHRGFEVLPPKSDQR